MRFTRRTIGLLLLGAGACLVGGPAVARLFAHPAEDPASPPRTNDSTADLGSAPRQDQPPNRREVSVTARDYQFSPSRIEVQQDDLVKLTVRSEDVAYSLTIDEYRVSRRIPAGGATTFEFRADRAGSFTFYSNLTSDPRHGQMRGELVVRER